MSNASNLFMQVDGIKGTVTDTNYKEWIAIEHVSNGVYSSAKIDNGSGQLNSEGVSFDSVSVSKELDSTSTQLINMVAQGSNVDKIIIAMNVKTDDKDNELARWTYENCIFTTCNSTASNGGGIPVEGLSFVFGSVKFETNMVEAGGKTSKQGPVGWDQVSNTKL